MFLLEYTFLRLLAVGQQREIELPLIFGYELYVVLPLVMDEYSYLRRGNKAILVHKLGVKHHKPTRSSCITWSGPVGKCGCAGGVTESAACILCCYRENPRF